MIKKYIILLFLVFLVPIKVHAACSDQEMIKLEKVVQNITTSYTFDESSKTFKITFTNLKPGLLLEDETTEKTYTANGEVTITTPNSGEHQFAIYDKSEKCSVIELRMLYVLLPYYNDFYKNSECNGIETFTYCNKWLNKKVTYDEWKTKVSDYIEKNKKEEKQQKKKEAQTNIIDTAKQLILKASKYYYIILPIVAGICLIIMYIKDKKDSLF